MASENAANSRPGLIKPLAGIGGRAAASALRPVTGTMRVAIRVGVAAERRVVERVLDSGELDRILVGVLNDTRIQGSLQRALESDGARRLVDDFFDSGLFEHLVERLLASDALWWLVDEIAQSPSVTAALSQQGLGFADQVAGAMRARSRKADHRVERTARHLRQRKHNGASTDSDLRGR